MIEFSIVTSRDIPEAPEWTWWWRRRRKWKWREHPITPITKRTKARPKPSNIQQTWACCVQLQRRNEPGFFRDYVNTLAEHLAVSLRRNRPTCAKVIKARIDWPKEMTLEGENLLSELQMREQDNFYNEATEENMFWRINNQVAFSKFLSQ